MWIEHDSWTFNYLKLTSSAGKMPSASFIEYEWHSSIQNAVLLFEALNRPYQE